MVLINMLVLYVIFMFYHVCKLICLNCLILYLKQSVHFSFAIKRNYYEYSALIFKYFDKNKESLIKQIPQNNHELLISLIQQPYASEKWIKLYFDICNKCNIPIKDKIVNDAIDTCQKLERDDKQVLIDAIKTASVQQN